MRTISLCAALIATVCFASVNEPNGMTVPVDSMNGEQQLYTMFSTLGEGVNWQTDAHTTPNQFSPLCGFTATYVLNQSALQLGLAWYNDTGVAPLASDLHTIVAPGTAVGAVITGSSIKSDPAYLGGLVGFALIGYETHYSNPAYDTVCTSCAPPGPWITAMIYASTKTANAYYMCFEDGQTSSSGWNNDGDFNDDVYFITGITCAGGGQPCSTGLSGICAAGLTQCTSNGTTCQQLNQPGTETCNGLDDNCDGTVDEGNLCPTGEVCSHGVCVNACGGEFGCPGNQVCSGGFCIDAQCASVSCDAGLVCNAGTCKGPCDGISCPGSQVCRVGRCVDPCVGVTCQSGQVCTDGVCVTGCSCQPCGGGKACAASGQCVDPSCANVGCDAGTHCATGACVDDCSGAVCPAGQLCTMGSCVAAPDAGGTGGGSGGGGGIGTGGGSASGGGSGSTGGGSASAGGGSANTGGGSAAGGGSGSGSKGCGCASGAGANALATIFGALVLVTLRRRRERKAQSRDT